MLPRRESERRVHPLARHCDILSAVETRISMLNMTFIKYIENNACCFIPGKVIDEIDRVLSLVESGTAPPRTHELLQELRDISSMAMEHFDEHILPNLKLRAENSPLIPIGSSPFRSPKLLVLQHTISDEIHKVKKQNKSHKQQIVMLTQHVQKLSRKIKRQSIRLKTQSAKIIEQDRKIQEQSTKIQEQESTLADLKKHMEEWDQKFSDLTAELIRAREDLTTKNIVPSPTVLTRPLSPPRLFKPNIRPRMAQILPKSFAAVHMDLERKRKSNFALSEIPNKLYRSLNIEDVKDKISDDITNKINESITNNISKNITDNFSNENNVKECDNRGLLCCKSDLSNFISNSLETILKTPINSIKSRKRKITEDIDLK